MLLATDDEQAVPSVIAWQLGNGEAECKKVRAYERNLFHTMIYSLQWWQS